MRRNLSSGARDGRKRDSRDGGARWADGDTKIMDLSILDIIDETVNVNLNEGSSSFGTPLNGTSGV